MIIGLSGHIGSGKDTVGMILQALTMEGIGTRWKSEPLEYVKAYEGRPNLKGGWEIKKFAEKLKQIASQLTGIPREKFEDQEFKKTFLGPEWDQWRVTWKHGDEGPGSETFKTKELAEKFIEDSFEDSLEEVVEAGLLTFERMTVREFLQKLGTEGLRNGLHTNVWVNALFADYKRKTQMGPDSFDSPTASGDYPNWIITDVRFPNEAQAIKELGGVVVRIERGFDELDLGPVQLHIERQPHTLHPSETALDNWSFDYVINNKGTLEQLLEATKTLLNNIQN